MYFPKQEDVFNLNDLKSFHGYIFPPIRMLLAVYLVYCLAISFQEKHQKKYQESKIFIHNPLQQFLYLKYMFQIGKKNNQTNQLSHYIVKHGQLLMQFCLT